MKKLGLILLLALAVTASGCVEPSTEESGPEDSQEKENPEPSGAPVKEVQTAGVAPGELHRVVMRDDGVVCYWADEYNSGGLSCMPISETNVEADRE